nr:dynein light chain 1, cytoplasmic-like [Ipomoea batatas]
MPMKMQIQAMSCAYQALDLYDVLDCKSIAAHIKKEFDKRYGNGKLWRHEKNYTADELIAYANINRHLVKCRPARPNFRNSSLQCSIVKKKCRFQREAEEQRFLAQETVQARQAHSRKHQAQPHLNGPQVKQTQVQLILQPNASALLAIAVPILPNPTSSSMEALPFFCSELKIAIPPQSTSYEAISHAYSPQRSQDQCDCGIGDFVGKHIGSVGNSNAALSAFSQVNLIETHAVGGDDFQEIGLGRSVPESEELEPLLELRFQIG